MAQYSFRLPNADYLGFPATTQAIVETACKAEDLGFDALFVNDHVIVDDLPRNELWRNVYDPMMVLSYVAARTSKIQLGTSVLIMPYRNPIVTAKMLATLDQMSGGRVIAGVGSGWNQAEYDALGEPFRQRGSRTNEYLQLWKACWAPGITTFQGRYFSFENMHVNPKPLQGPHPPIWVGGSGTGSLRRAARFAQVTVQTWWVELVESCRKSKGGQFCGYVKPAAWTRALTLRPLPVKSCWRSSPNGRLLFWSCRLQLRHSRRSSSSCSGGLRLWKERPSPAAPGECLGSSLNRASGPPGRNKTGIQGPTASPGPV